MLKKYWDYEIARFNRHPVIYTVITVVTLSWVAYDVLRSYSDKDL